jgi:N-acetylglutamate synthase and related acetyltransferases
MDLDEKFIINNEEYLIRAYHPKDSTNLLEFFKLCLPESGRNFEPDRAHASLLQVEKNYEYFVCFIEQKSGKLIGTCALKNIGEIKCELKCVYLYKKYHGLGLGTMMCKKVIDMAKDIGYKEMYLDTISETSGRAIKMYKRLGFELIDKYHDAVRSDVFMRLILE